MAVGRRLMAEHEVGYINICPTFILIPEPKKMMFWVTTSLVLKYNSVMKISGDPKKWADGRRTAPDGGTKMD